MKAFRPAMLLSYTLLPACTTLGPEFELPQAPVRADWQPLESENLSTTSTDLKDWRTVLNDDMLNSLMATVARENLPFQIAGIRISEARARLSLLM